MATDAATLTPLCTVGRFTSGGFADLVTDYPTDALVDNLADATRIAEDLCDRRLVPFTVTETSRAEGIDPDEYAGATSMPVSLQTTVGMSYASSLGISNLVRHAWLRQYPPKYQDMWQMPQTLGVEVYRSFGGNQILGDAQILLGPDETGHVWFELGQFIPVGSRFVFTYSGGYSPIPSSLVRIGELITASLIVRELNPDDVNHNPDQLFASAVNLLKLGKWVRM